MPNNIKPPVGQEEAVQNHTQNDSVKKTAIWYASVAFLQDSESVQEIDKLLGKKDKEVLAFVTNWDQGDEIDLSDTYKNTLRSKGDKIVAQNDYYTLVQNNVAGETYELLRNVPVSDVRYVLQHNGYRGVDFPNSATQDIQDLARQMKAEDLATYRDKEKQLVEKLGPSFNYTYPVGHSFTLVDSETSLPHEVYGFYTGNGHLNFKFADKNDNVPLANLDSITWDVLGKIADKHKQEMELMRNPQDTKESVDLLLKNDTTVWHGYLGNFSTKTLKELREDLKNRNDFDEESMKYAKAGQRKELESRLAIRNDNMSQVQSELERRLGYNFDMLSQLQENCEHYLTDWRGDESRLYNGNVDDEIKQMRSLYDDIPAYMKPQWINKESIDGYDKAMHGVKFLTENKEMSSPKQAKMFAKLQGITEKQASSLLAISSAAVTLLSGLNGVQKKAKPLSVDEEVDKYLKDRVDEGLSKGWFIVHVPDYFPENSKLGKTDFHDALMFFSPQGIQHHILNKQQLDYAKEQNAIVLTFNRDEYHDIYVGAQSDTEDRIKHLARTSDNLKEDLRKETQIAKSNIIGSLNAIREGGNVIDDVTKDKINATHSYECDILASLGVLMSLNNHTYQYIAKELEGRDIYYADTNQNVSLGKFHRDMEMENMAQPSTRDYYDTSVGTKQALRIVEAYREGDARVFEQFQWKMTPEQVEARRHMFESNTLSDGRKVEDFRVYKEGDQRKPDYGKWRIYIQVGEMKMSRTMSAEDLDALFNYKTTVGELAEKNFGEHLHLASFYNKFKFPQGSNVEQVRLIKNKEGVWLVQADLGEKGLTSRAVLTWNDKQALFNSKTATKEQLAARYLNKEISQMLKNDVHENLEFKKEPTLGKGSIDWPKYFVYGLKEDGNSIFIAQFHENELEKAKAYADSVVNGKEQVTEYHSGSNVWEKGIKMQNVAIFDGMPTIYVKNDYENGVDIDRNYMIYNQDVKLNPFKHEFVKIDDGIRPLSQEQNKTVYDVFGMKDGHRTLVKVGLSINKASNFVIRNEAKYQRKGYDYLIFYPHNEVQYKASVDLSASVNDNKVIENSDQPRRRKFREPQMVTVNGEKISHGHAFQSNKNPENWFYSVSIDGTCQVPKLMTAEDIKAWKNHSLSVEDAMKHYYPTKLMKKVTPEEYKVDNKLSDGRYIDKFVVYREHNENSQNYGKYMMYTQVGNRKITKPMSYEDTCAYFDQVTTQAKLVEKNFGEELNLASAYKKYQIPKEAGVENIYIGKNMEGVYAISASGSFGHTDKRILDRNDVYSFFHSKTATKEQLAAKYFSDGFTPVQDKKQSQIRGRKL